MVLARYIQRTLPARNTREWYWALMDYGAMLGRSGDRVEDPNHRSAHYKRQSLFKGSDRALRGSILRSILHKKKITISTLSKELGESPERVRRIASALAREGFAR